MRILLVKETRYNVRDCAACLFWHQCEPNWQKIVWQNPASHMASGQLESLGVQSAQLSVPAGHDWWICSGRSKGWLEDQTWAWRTRANSQNRKRGMNTFGASACPHKTMLLKHIWKSRWQDVSQKPWASSLYPVNSYLAKFRLSRDPNLILPPWFIGKSLYLPAFSPFFMGKSW